MVISKKQRNVFRVAFQDAQSITDTESSITAVYYYNTRDGRQPEDAVAIESNGSAVSVYDAGGDSEVRVKRSVTPEDLRNLAFAEAVKVVAECSWPNADLSVFRGQ